MTGAEIFEAGQIDKRWQTLIHLIALAMTLLLALSTNHLFWWVFTGFNLWVALCWLLYLATVGLKRKGPEQT